MLLKERANIIKIAALCEKDIELQADAQAMMSVTIFEANQEPPKKVREKKVGKAKSAGKARSAGTSSNTVDAIPDPQVIELDQLDSPEITQSAPLLNSVSNYFFAAPEPIKMEQLVKPKPKPGPSQSQSQDQDQNQSQSQDQNQSQSQSQSQCQWQDHSHSHSLFQSQPQLSISGRLCSNGLSTESVLSSSRSVKNSSLQNTLQMRATHEICCTNRAIKLNRISSLGLRPPLRGMLLMSLRHSRCRTVTNGHSHSRTPMSQFQENLFQLRASAVSRNGIGPLNNVSTPSNLDNLEKNALNDSYDFYLLNPKLSIRNIELLLTLGVIFQDPNISREMVLSPDASFEDVAFLLSNRVICHSSQLNPRLLRVLHKLHTTFDQILKHLTKGRHAQLYGIISNQNSVGSQFPHKYVQKMVSTRLKYCLDKQVDIELQLRHASSLYKLSESKHAQRLFDRLMARNRTFEHSPSCDQNRISRTGFLWNQQESQSAPGDMSQIAGPSRPSVAVGFDRNMPSSAAAPLTYLKALKRGSREYQSGGNSISEEWKGKVILAPYWVPEIQRQLRRNPSEIKA